MDMTRMRFGTFLAPHHPLGEHPALLFRRDLDFAAHLDALGFDEFWCGEHHSTGWEMIASPEMFLAAAGERTHRIMLGTGVTSLPYHHPFQVAQRIVQLDHMTQGRAMFGSGPGALPSDADMFMVEHAPTPRHARRGTQRDPSAHARRNRELRNRLVQAQRRHAANFAVPREPADGDRIVFVPVGHEVGRQVRHRRVVDRFQHLRRSYCASYPVGIR